MGVSVSGGVCEWGCVSGCKCVSGGVFVCYVLTRFHWLHTLRQREVLFVDVKLRHPV